MDEAMGNNGFLGEHQTVCEQIQGFKTCLMRLIAQPVNGRQIREGNSNKRE